MKVLLLFKPNPKMINIQQNVIPNGLLYIAALLLSKNIDVEILNLANKNYDECKDIIKEKNPDIVGIGCYTFNRHACVKLAKIVKEIDQKIKVVFGGPHSSVMFKQLLETSEDIDMIVLNEGETTFLEIIDNIQKGMPTEDIHGIVYVKDNKIIYNGVKKPLENLDELPIPADYFKYKRIITSRGCPGRCIFCDTPFLWGQRIRFRSSNNVVDELEILNKKHGISSFIISDDTFTFDKQRTVGICKEIIKRNLKITWGCRSRVSLVCEERLRWMKKAGCISISYGIESGSQKILNNLKKGITVEQIKKAAELTRKFGLKLNYFIIVGSPGETDDTIRETMNIIKETKPTSIFTYIMQLTPGTEIYEMAKQDGFIQDNDWITKTDETIFYSSEKSIEELNRYMRYVNEFFNLLGKYFQYDEKELKEIMREEEGVQDLINMAHIRMKDKKPDEAETLINKAIELNHGSSEALMDKAVILAMKEDGRCTDCFNKAIKADPENIPAYKNLGLFFYKQKRYNEAINAFKKAIEVEPADIESYNNLGSVYGTQKRYKESIEAFEMAFLIDHNDKGTLNNLALTFEKQGNAEKANEFRERLKNG